ncbi:hypothetical protein AB0M44_36700 [Streptosporangium subroseum]
MCNHSAPSSPAKYCTVSAATTAIVARNGQTWRSRTQTMIATITCR